MISLLVGLKLPTNKEYKLKSKNNIKERRFIMILAAVAVVAIVVVVTMAKKKK